MSKLGISFFTWPAAKSIAGIAITFFIERSFNFSKASTSEGLANSKKPYSTKKFGNLFRIKLVNSLKKGGILVHKIRYEGRKIVLYTPEAEKTLHNILHAIEKDKETLLDIDLNKPTISEVFESLVKK